MTWGVACGLLLCLVTGLSPFSSVDRSALVLLAITVALPLGCISRTSGESLANGQRAAITGLFLALTVSAGDPWLGLLTALWIVPVTLFGAAALGATGQRWVGMPLSAGWILLCGLPFLYQTSELAGWFALHLNPWLGMSMDVVGGDPLRREVIYMGEKSPLIDAPAQALMGSGVLWLFALSATVALVIRLRFTREQQT
ncbi:MAG: hypothetical protein ACYTDT_10005 [Planctomycetota bacterium]|jgi:hypothetical protein